MTPLIILSISILAGFMLRKKRIPLLPPATLSVVIWLLLFLLGISVGSNPDVVNNIAHYGLQALVIGGLATIGSVLAAYLLARISSRKKNHER